MSLFDIKFRDGSWAVAIAETAEEAIWNVCRDSEEERADIATVERIPDTVEKEEKYSGSQL